MRILNPKLAPVDAAAPHIVRKDAVLAAIAALPPATRAFSYDELRAALGLDDKQLPDGAIMQICIDAGIKSEL